MSGDRIEKLGTLAADAVMNGAAEYLRSQGVYSPSDDDVEALLVIVRESAKSALGPAMDDANKAIKAGMPAVASATFSASFRLAGINAAKQFLASLA